MSKQGAETADVVTKSVEAGEGAGRLPLRGWALEMARRWNAGTYSLFVLHGNIFDVFPVQSGAKTSYLPLKTFLSKRLFPDRGSLLFYDIGDGLSFGSAEMQKRFFEWLAVYDDVEGTAFHQHGPPREFTKLAPLLRRFFLRNADDKKERKGVTLIIDFPEKIIPASEEAGASWDERMALVTLLKWAASASCWSRNRRRSCMRTSCRIRTSRRCGSICRMRRSGCAFCNPAGLRRWRTASR